MNDIYFKINASHNAPVSESWRTQLTAMMGGKPRRLSTWCELGLFGALSFIKTTSKTFLPGVVPIRVYTESGTISTTWRAIEQNKEHMPMPFTFMQTQPSQLFNALGGALSWNGDGATFSSKNRHEYENFVLRDIQQSSVLAWVEEDPSPKSAWIWLEKTTFDNEKSWQKIDSVFHTTTSASWLKLSVDGEIYQAP
jgi:hypothetical protein